MIVGTEWLIEAEGCDSEKLRDELLLRDVLTTVVEELGLRTIDLISHKFGGEGGVTVMIALTESHLTCHTYPEHELATFNLYCCNARPEWDWGGNLSKRLEARKVTVTRLDRGTFTRSAVEGGSQ